MTTETKNQITSQGTTYPYIATPIEPIYDNVLANFNQVISEHDKLMSKLDRIIYLLESIEYQTRTK